MHESDENLVDSGCEKHALDRNGLVFKVWVSLYEWLKKI